MFKIFRRGEDSEKDLPPSEDQEKGPDDETLERIRQIDETIAKSDELLGGLDRLAKEKIFSSQGSPEYDEIYAPQEIGRGELSSKDAWAFEPAGKGLAVRNAIKRVVTFGLAGSKYALERQAGMTAEGSLVDTRKLKGKIKQGMTASGGIELEKPELKEVAERLGLDAAEMDPNKYGKKYQEGKRAESKVYLSDRTKAETEETAGEILTRRLAELESNDRELVGIIQGLKRFNKEVENTKDSFKGQPNEAKVLAGFEEEKMTRTAKIAEQQTELMSGKSGVEVIRQPLLNRQEDLNKALAELSPVLKDVSAQEEAYKTGKKSLQDKMRNVRQTQEVSQMEDVKTIMEKWQAEEEQVDINSAGFREEKKKLNLRITDLRRSQVEVGRMLVRINKIGKTGEDLTAEEPAKKKKRPVEQAKEKRPRPKKVTGQPKEELPTEPGVSDKWSDNAPEGTPTRKKEPVPQSEGEKAAGESANQIYQALVAEERRKVELDQQSAEAEQPVVRRKVSISEFISGWFKPRGGMRGPDIQPGAEVAAVVAPTADRNAPESAVKAMPPATEPEGNDSEDEVHVDGGAAAATEAVAGAPKTGEIKPEPKTEIKKPEDKTAAGVILEPGPTPERRAEKKETMPIEYWVDKLFEITLEGDAVKVMKEHFKLGQEYDPNAPMTLTQAMNAYGGYLVEAKKVVPGKAIETVKEHFRRKFKNNKKVVQEIEAVADAWLSASKQKRIFLPRSSKNTPPVAETPASVDLEQTFDGASNAIVKTSKAGEGKKSKDQGEPKAGATPGTTGSEKPRDTREPKAGASEASAQAKVIPNAEGGGEPKISADELLNALGANGDKVWASQEEKLKVGAEAGTNKAEDKEEPKAGTPTALTAEPVALESESGSGVERKRTRASRKGPRGGERISAARNWMTEFGLKKDNKVAEGYFVPSGENRRVLITEDEAVESYVKWAVEVKHLKEEDARKEVEGFLNDNK